MSITNKAVNTKIKGIAFDLDGTLVDSIPDLTAATQAMLAELNLTSCSEAQVRTWVGNGASVLISRAVSWAKGYDISQAELDEIFPLFMVHYGQFLDVFSRFYKWVPETLSQLKKSGFKLAVITNKPHCFAVPLLKSFGIFDEFDIVLGGDALAKKKPDPYPLEYVMTKWGLTPDEFLMVGDSKNDILAAKSAGCSSIGLTYGYNYGEDIGLSGPSAVYDQFSEILTFLGISQENVMQAVVEQ